MEAKLFSVSQLEQHARTLAGWHEVGPSGGSGDRLLSRLAADEIAFRDAHALVTEAVKSGTRITPAAEWFIDNYHLIEDQIRTARRHLPRGYSRSLPKLSNAPTTGMPRVYDIALELISHTHGTTLRGVCKAAREAGGSRPDRRRDLAESRRERRPLAPDQGEGPVGSGFGEGPHADFRALRLGRHGERRQEHHASSGRDHLDERRQARGPKGELPRPVADGPAIES